MKLSHYLSDLSVIGVNIALGPNGDDTRIDLVLESMECSYFLGGEFSIPYDPTIFDELDLRTFDDRLDRRILSGCESRTQLIRSI